MLRRFAVAAVALVASSSNAGHLRAEGSTEKGPLILQGRWTGEGTLKPEGAPQEKFKCVATYFPAKLGHEVKQNLRCQSHSYKFDIASLFEIDGEKVSGTWREKTYEFEGAIDGVVKKDRYDVRLSGDFFEADMVIEGTACQQMLTVTPTPDMHIEYMTAFLKKC
mgnify:CR=1 FL=1